MTERPTTPDGPPQATPSKYSRPDDVLLRTVGDETLILNTATERYFQLDPIGSRILQLVLAGDSFDDAVTDVCQNYDAPRDVVAADTNELIASLLDAGLLHAEDS